LSSAAKTWNVFGFALLLNRNLLKAGENVPAQHLCSFQICYNTINTMGSFIIDESDGV
jgi:hypothetical protein